MAIGSDQFPTPRRPRIHTRRIMMTLSSLALVAAGLMLAPSASADSVQVQSYQRATQSQTCATQPGETPWQAAWGADSSWHPTWEQWANGGTGGWTCTRSISWARGTTLTSSGLGCTQIQQAPAAGLWVDFGSGYVAPPLHQTFADQGCSITWGGGLANYAVVWAADRGTGASMCATYDSTDSQSSADHDYISPNIYMCYLPE